MNFKFREPYQVLVDEEIILESVKTKFDLVRGLERTLGGQVKTMITQCTIDDLYKTKNAEAIELAKSFERRRCGHAKIEELLKREEEKRKEAEKQSNEEKEEEEESEEEEDEDNTEKKDTKEKENKDGHNSQKRDKPKKIIRNAFDCMAAVVIQNSENKHRYVVATQKIRLRQLFRTIPAIPLIYLNRSVMILEPMSRATETKRAQIEESKLYGSDLAHLKRKEREEEESEDQPKKKKKGPRGPNPLSVKKKKTGSAPGNTDNEEGAAKKRKRRHKRSTAELGTAASGVTSTA